MPSRKGCPLVSTVRDGNLITSFLSSEPLICSGLKPRANSSAFAIRCFNSLKLVSVFEAWAFPARPTARRPNGHAWSLLAPVSPAVHVGVKPGRQQGAGSSFLASAWASALSKWRQFQHRAIPLQRRDTFRAASGFSHEVVLSAAKINNLILARCLLRRLDAVDHGPSTPPRGQSGGSRDAAARVGMRPGAGEGDFMQYRLTWLAIILTFLFLVPGEVVGHIFAFLYRFVVSGLFFSGNTIFDMSTNGWFSESARKGSPAEYKAGCRPFGRLGVRQNHERRRLPHGRLFQHGPGGGDHDFRPVHQLRPNRIGHEQLRHRGQHHRAGCRPVCRGGAFAGETERTQADARLQSKPKRAAKS